MYLYVVIVLEDERPVNVPVWSPTGQSIDVSNGVTCPCSDEKTKRTMLEYIFKIKSPPRGMLARLTIFLRTNYCHTNLYDA
jgi:hypothetical protein